MIFLIIHSANYNGWCIYTKKKEDDILVSFWSGPFESKEHAASEAKRLNYTENNN